MLSTPFLTVSGVFDHASRRDIVSDGGVSGSFGLRAREGYDNFRCRQVTLGPFNIGGRFRGVNLSKAGEDARSGGRGACGRDERPASAHGYGGSAGGFSEGGSEASRAAASGDGAPRALSEDGRSGGRGRWPSRKNSQSERATAHFDNVFPRFAQMPPINRKSLPIQFHRPLLDLACGLTARVGKPFIGQQPFERLG